MRNRINLSRLGVLSASAEFRRDTRFIKRSGGMLSSMRPLHVRQCVFGSAVVRNPKFNSLQPHDVKFFQNILGDQNVITDHDSLKPLNTDWMNKYHGSSQLALEPSSTKQVSEILKYCNERRLAVVPQGGNTGLVGGSVPLFDEVIVTTKRMRNIVSFDEFSGVLVAEAGCILENLDNYLAAQGFMMPLDLGAKGSCQIGGNVSTNAGGLRLVRYGSLHGNVLGLEVVLADGRVLDLMSVLRKDNTGYDLKQLFIGAEGTLGIVTKVSVLTPRRPKSINVAYLACSSYANVLLTLNKAKAELGEILSAIEFQDRQSLEVVLAHQPGTRDPLDQPHSFYVLIETSGSDASHDQQVLNGFLESALDSQCIVDGTVAADATQIKALWTLRESVAESAGKHGANYKYDVSLPTAKLYDLVHQMQSHLKEEAVCCGYGHLGDGNLHLNILVPAYSPRLTALIEPYVFECVAAHAGSISAEHGIGQGKPQFLHFSKSAVAIDIMHNVKASLDPNGIMNPYKLLPLYIVCQWRKLNAAGLSPGM